MSLTLFTYFRSSTSFRVRIALNLKKVAHEKHYINLLDSEQKSEEFAQVNPNQGVPALKLADGTVLIESMAIIEYLEEAYPEPALLPKDPVQRAKVRGFCEIINSSIHPYHNLNLFEYIDNLAKGFDRVQFVHPIIVDQFNVLESLLTNPGKFAFGDQVTFADLFLVPQVLAAVSRFKVDIAQFPKLAQVYENAKNLPEFIAAQPDQQPDFK